MSRRTAAPPVVRPQMATPRQVAEYLQVSLNTLYDWRRKRTGPKAAKAGVHLRYDWADVYAWVDEQKATAA